MVPPSEEPVREALHLFLPQVPKSSWGFPSEGVLDGMSLPGPNKAVETNRRSASPLNALRRFERALRVPPFLSVAVAHLYHWDQGEMPEGAGVLDL